MKLDKHGNLYQIMKVLRVNQLQAAILSDSIDQIGKFKTVQRLVNLNADDEKMWFEELILIMKKELNLYRYHYTIFN